MLLKSTRKTNAILRSVYKLASIWLQSYKKEVEPAKRSYSDCRKSGRIRPIFRTQGHAFFKRYI